MVHGYHAIFGTYGFWLPNDPRGSWSEFVGKWELVRFGRATKSTGRSKLSAAEQRARIEAKQLLKYPEVVFNGEQARSVATGFRNAIEKSGFTVWACSILPQHVHLVIGRHSYKVEQIVNLMKGEATKQLRREDLHPMAEYSATDPGSTSAKKNRLPAMWAARRWKVYLDDEEAIDNAIHYVEQNPIEEGKPAQKWSFLQPFTGLDQGWVTYH